MSTLDTWITDHAARTPDAIALVFESSSWSYAALAAEIDACTAVLMDQGIKAGERVVWVGHNHPQLLVTLFACARLGAIVLPINWRLSQAEMQYVLDDAAPLLMLCDEPMRAQAETLASANTTLRCIDVDSTSWANSHSGRVAKHRDDTITAMSPLLLVYTSGTTGRPKGAVLSQHALTVNAQNCVHMHGLTAADHILAVLPMFHVGGLNILTTPALYVGGCVTVHRRFDPAHTLQAFNTGLPTLCVLVPATIQAVSAHPAWQETALGSLRMLTTGSSIVAPEILEIFEQRGTPVVQVYGCTETCPVSAYQQPDEKRLLPGSTGRAALHSEIHIVDSTGNFLAAGQEGEIVVVGDHVLSCYWNNPEASEAARVQGGFATGDLGYLDKNGYLFVLDRARDLIISGGENVYPAEIERVLLSVPGVTDVAVTGTTDPTWGEVPVAWLTVDENAFSLDAAKAALHVELARFKHPRDWHVIDTFPRSPLGKIQKFALQQPHET